MKSNGYIRQGAGAKQHEIQHLLIVLDQLGKDFELNRDIYYTLGRYLGYTDTSLLKIKSQKDPISWILCSTCVKMSPVEITDFISTLEQYFTQYGHWESFQLFIIHNSFSSLLSSTYWKLY